MAPPTCPTKWLPSLKVRQLQRLASLTGILSSGTKPVLIERLGQVINGEPRCAAQNASQEESLINPKKPASILSIDMGIRNLAFAHLVVPPGQAGELKSPILNAWYRLSVSSFVANLASEKQVLDFHMGEEMKPQNKIAKGSRSTALDILEAGQCDGKGKEKEKKKEKEKESFAPKLYATHAYTLMSSLLATYKPTHVLIERQRFRSGGGSSVQEWTIRVGVFEGMLYAVLRAIQLERKGDVANIVVEGVEPQRVMKYWMDEEEEEIDLQPKGKKTEVLSTKKISRSMTPNRRKQIKIDRIGKLLSSFTGSDASGIGLADLGDHIDIQFGDDRRMHEVVKAYLKKWGKKTKRTNAKTRGGSTRPTASSTSSSSISSDKASHFAADDLQTLDIEKLDDLADCLLQAMTWLEWQNTRQKIARCGLEAVSSKIGN
ncbi:hypothetical protein EMPG_11535 [Blastomyces silverae]|uniref:SAP domain-containing protein n=1 Tax=Blastomyces silverae TaxID=2060906 RepID=A0A0H1BWU2_9EURO|nr:hypothetical protein EMPG_11535 [Blastomyces silverae]